MDNVGLRQHTEGGGRMSEQCTAMGDPRPVKEINGNRWTFGKVGIDGVTRIEAYGEPGEMSHVLWFAVYYGDDQPKKRVNGKYVATVIYFDEEPQP